MHWARDCTFHGENSVAKRATRYFQYPCVLHSSQERADQKVLRSHYQKQFFNLCFLSVRWSLEPIPYHTLRSIDFQRCHFRPEEM